MDSPGLRRCLASWYTIWTAWIVSDSYLPESPDVAFNVARDSLVYNSCCQVDCRRLKGRLEAWHTVVRRGFPYQRTSRSVSCEREQNEIETTHIQRARNRRFVRIPRFRVAARYLQFRWNSPSCVVWVPRGTPPRDIKKKERSTIQLRSNTSLSLLGSNSSFLGHGEVPIECYKLYVYEVQATLSSCSVLCMLVIRKMWGTFPGPPARGILRKELGFDVI